MPGVPWHTQYFADQLTLFQPGGTDYAHLITTGIPRFSDLPTALKLLVIKSLKKSKQRFGEFEFEYFGGSDVVNKLLFPSF